MWQGIIECVEMSRTDRYNEWQNLRECLQRRLYSLIKQHIHGAICWLDLASCHYYNDQLEWYEKNNVTCVPKKINPSNCPENRPIQFFWAGLGASEAEEILSCNMFEKTVKQSYIF